MDQTAIDAPAIETLHLCKVFTPPRGLMRMLSSTSLKEPVTAVDGVTLRIGKGELFGLLGPNGAGKTTLVKILCTLVLPSSGTATVNGYDVVRKEEAVRRSIGLVGTEERSFYWRLTGRQNLEFFATLQGLSGRDLSGRVDEVIEMVGLGETIDRMFQTYSSGTKQKMCIARGLLTNPDVLFLDEPTRSVDPIAAESIRQLVRDLLVKQQRRTVVLTTHRLEEAAQVCDRIAIMDKGRIRACGTLGDLRMVLRAPCRYQITVSRLVDEVRRAIERLQGVEDLDVSAGEFLPAVIRFRSARSGAALSTVIRMVVESGEDVLDCTAEDVSIEEVFRRLVRGEEADGVPATVGIS